VHPIKSSSKYIREKKEKINKRTLNSKNSKDTSTAMYVPNPTPKPREIVQSQHVS
jgi:hypothetical protein